jgi:hypothetical protein
MLADFFVPKPHVVKQVQIIVFEMCFQASVTLLRASLIFHYVIYSWGHFLLFHTSNNGTIASIIHVPCNE